MNNYSNVWGGLVWNRCVERMAKGFWVLTKNNFAQVLNKCWSSMQRFQLLGVEGLVSTSKNKCVSSLALILIAISLNAILNKTFVTRTR